MISQIYNPCDGNLIQINEIENLNLLEPESCENYGRLKESSVKDLTKAMVRPVFRNIEQEIIE